MSSTRTKPFSFDNQVKRVAGLWTPKNLNLNTHSEILGEYSLNMAQKPSDLHYTPAYMQVPLADYDTFIEHLE